MKRRTRRKPKVLSPQDPQVKQKKDKVLPQLKTMRPPNHTVSVDPWTEEDVSKSHPAVPPRARWPIVLAMRRGPDGRGAPAFVDPTHGVEFWGSWADHPPTWMDPTVFIKMARRDKECRRLMRICHERESRRAFLLLQQRMQYVFEHRYLPYLFERFDGEIGGMLAEWLMANHLMKQEYPDTGPHD